MLSNLNIRNFALFDEVNLAPGQGLNVFTGETGAGKSLLVGAIGLILGKRLDSSLIFDQKRKCIVEAVFDNIPDSILQFLSGRDEFDTDGNKITIRREADEQGRSRAFVNDTPVSNAILRDVTGYLVDLHGQHENQQLLSEIHQLRLLDEYAGLSDRVRDFRLLFEKRNALARELEALEAREKTARQQADFLSFQIAEIESARLDPQSDNEIDSELNLVENAEESIRAISGAVDELYESEQSLYSRITNVISAVRPWCESNKKSGNILLQLHDAALAIAASSRDLSKLASTIEADPRRLEELRERQNLVNRLKLKFSTADVGQLLKILEEFRSQLQSIDSISGQISATGKQLEELTSELLIRGEALESERKASAATMEKSINGILKIVGLKDARFRIQIDRLEAEPADSATSGNPIRMSKNGLNRVAYQVQPNRGTPGGPLGKIASGGEISRVMLAIKAAVAEKASMPVLIFDEIDTGISGETAKKVAKVMVQLSSKYQLIAITHLPQIAGMGEFHFEVSKKSAGKETVSGIRQLQGEDRVKALAVMISGANPTAIAMESARELLGR